MADRKSGSDWTPDRVRRLWDWYGANPYVQGSYFTAMVGRGVVEFLSAAGRLEGRALDYGCGPGHLIGHLLDRGLECRAVDSSPESIRAVDARYAGRPNWRGGVVAGGVPLPFPDAHFDVVTCVETLEHLPEQAGLALVAELARVLRPRGTGIFTVPFAEEMARNAVYCPFCDAEFHKWQHARSFDARTLGSLLAEGGLEVRFCGNLDFGAFQRTPRLFPLRELSPAVLSAWIGSRARRLLDRLFPEPFPGGREFRHRVGAGGPHLCAVVSRPAG
jgi:SAM-dependent methyltransferase